ncbi:MAG: hypothetical protein ACXVUL_08625 [Solirubrobacteraceae bacterium]
MNDPFDMLRTDLVNAAARAQLVSPRRRWAWLRGRSHPVAVGIAALVVCGGAAAAVVSLTASSSQPLSGRVPGRPAPGRPGAPVSVAGYRYSIRVTPSLSSGSSGWAVWTAYKGPPFGGGLGGGGGGGYPTPTTPIFQGGGVAPWSIPTGANSKGGSVGFVVTGPQVAAVRIGDRTIRTFSSSQLPAGDRAAVFFLAAGAPTPVVGWRPGQPIDSRMRAPTPGPRFHLTSIRTTAVLPLDSAGQVLATGASPPDDGYVRGWSFWQAPSAVTPNIHEPRYRGRTRPRPGICELTQHGLPGLTPEWGSTIRSLPTVKDYLGELFVSCVSTEYYLHGWPMAAAVLLDARRPGAALGPIPGADPVPGHPDLVDFAGASLSARRVGDAWLVVQGGSGTTQRLSVLQALQINKLDLRHLTP